MVPVKDLLNGFWGETLADGKPSALGKQVAGHLWPAFRGLASRMEEGFLGMDEQLHGMGQEMAAVKERLTEIEVFVAMVPDVMKKLRGIKAFQSTIFFDLQAIGYRLEEKVVANQADSQAILARIEETLDGVLAAMGPEEVAEFEGSVPKDQGYLKSVLDKIKFKIPLIPLAYAIISKGEPAALALLGTAMTRSLELDGTVPDHAKGLIRLWDDMKFRVANLILPGGRR